MKKFLGHPLIIVLSLMVFPPLGIFLMFSFSNWSNGWKMALATVFSIIFIVAIVQSIQQEAAYLAQQNMAAIATKYRL